jgi:hypothetical protein
MNWKNIIKKNLRGSGGSDTNTIMYNRLVLAGKLPITLTKEVLRNVTVKELRTYGRMLEVMSDELVEKVVKKYLKYRTMLGDKAEDGSFSRVRQDDFNLLEPEEVRLLTRYLLHLIESR